MQVYFPCAVFVSDAEGFIQQSRPYDRFPGNVYRLISMILDVGIHCTHTGERITQPSLFCRTLFNQAQPTSLRFYSSSGASAGGKQKCRDDRSEPTCHFTDMERHQHSEVISRGLRRSGVRWSKQKNSSLPPCKISSCLKIADVMTVCCCDSLHSFLGHSLKLCECQVGFFLLTLFPLPFFPPLTLLVISSVLLLTMRSK